jgi:hypothetical protein
MFQRAINPLFWVLLEPYHFRADSANIGFKGVASIDPGQVAFAAVGRDIAL